MGTSSGRSLRDGISRPLENEEGATTCNDKLYAKKRFDYLRKVQKEPDKYVKRDSLLQSLKSQGALAALEIDEEAISPCALNTLKKSAQLTLGGGFAELDALRMAVAEALQQSLNRAANPRETKTEIKRRLADAEGRIKQLAEDLWQVSRAFHKAMTNARAYAKDSNRADLIERCVEDERELRCMVSLARNKSAAELYEVNHD